MPGAEQEVSIPQPRFCEVELVKIRVVTVLTKVEKDYVSIPQPRFCEVEPKFSSILQVSNVYRFNPSTEIL